MRTPSGTDSGPDPGTDGRLLTLVVNLDRSPERWQRISGQLQALGLPFQRLAAVDARQLQPEQLAQLDDAGFRRCHGKVPLPGELGCYLSHVKAMQTFLASDADFALVLEDDASPSDRLPAAVAGLLAQPRRWDMVKLSAVHSGTPVRCLQVAPGQHLAVMLSRCTGSSAYIVNRHAAQRYVQCLLPIRVPYDHAFDRGWVFGTKVRLLDPPPCGHGDDSASTIAAVAAPAATATAPAPAAAPAAAGPAPGSRLHWTQRLGTYRYRLFNELSRFRYGVVHAWQERMTRG